MITQAMLSAMECEIVIPDGVEGKSEGPRQIIDINDDRRRYPRQSCQILAALKYESTFPALRRSDRLYRVILRNLSRAGVGFLHGEEMFPGENAQFAFLNGTQRNLQVKRCRRIGPKCYEIGGDFDELLHDVTEGNWR